MSGEPFDLDTLDVYRGDAFSEPIEDVAADETTPTDLTAYGPAWSALYRYDEDGPVVGAFTIDTSNLATGVVTLALTGAQTAAMDRREYVFDVQVTGGPVDPITVYKGKLIVDRDVTR